MFVPKTGNFTIAAYIIVCILLGVAFIFGMTKLPSRYRKPIVVSLTFVLGFVYFVEFMIPGRPTAPIRSELQAARSYLNVVQQDLYAVIIGRGNRSERIGHAQQTIDKALVYLNNANKLVSIELPIAKQKADDATEAATKWVEAHHLPDSYYTKDSDGKIDDAHTKPLKKLAGDLGDASILLAGDPERLDLQPGIVARLKAEKTQLNSASKDDLNRIRGSIIAAANSIKMSGSSLTDNFLSPYMEPLSNAILVISTFAFALGLYSLASVHGKTLLKKRQGWGSSLAFFIAAISIMIAAFLKQYLGKGNWQSINYSIFMILFDGALKALSATMFSLVAFYIVSAAYRAFRIKTAESALMLIAAFLIMLALVPFGAMIINGLPIHGWLQVLRLEKIGTWILNYPNAAAQRGMMFGIGVGALAMSLRIWLSLERGSYFDKQM